MAKVKNWRLLERELANIASEQGFDVRQDRWANKIIGMGTYTFNLSHFAQQLANRGVLVDRTVVGVKE